MGELLAQSTEEVKSNNDRVQEAKQVVIRAAEEKKAQLAAAAAKKSKATKKGAKKDDAGADDDNKTTIMRSEEDEEGELNLNDPIDFEKALRKEVPRPFTFGPIEFTELNLTEAQKSFEINEQLQRIIDSLDLHMAQPSCCIRGHTVQVRGRNFKRRSTMLKHGRFMQNLKVSPVFPTIVQAAPEEEEDNIDGEGEDE